MTQIAGEAQRSLGRNDLIQPELKRGFSKNLGLSRSMFLIQVTVTSTSPR